MYLYFAKYLLNYYRYPRLSDDELLSRQIIRLNKLIGFAGKHVPFYRNLYKNAGVLGMIIRYPEDTDKIPIVKKNDFRKVKPSELVSAVGLGKLNERYTSGTTGEPFLVRTTKEAEYTAHMRIFLTLAKYGYRPSDSMLIFLRLDPDGKLQVERDIGMLKFVQDKLGLFEREIVSIYENKDTIIEKLEALSPYAFISTPSLTRVLINHLKERQIVFKIPLIFLSAEAICPSLLQDIHHHLGVTVINMYGSMECPSIGYEINGSGIMNIYTESCFMELQNETLKKEGYSEVILSNLLNYAQPVIRYCVNDLAINIENRNKGIRNLGKIIGRIDDIITISDGTVITSHHAYEMFHDFYECRQFKFMQDQGKVKLLLVIDEKSDKEYVLSKAQERLGKRYPQIRINIEFVSEIKPDPHTGKIKNIEVIC